MTVVRFTKNLQRHVACPVGTVDHVAGITIGEVLTGYFAQHPAVRTYVLDDQGGVRKHVTIFVGEQTIHDRTKLSDPVGPADEIYVMQALSGG